MSKIAGQRAGREAVGALRADADTAAGGDIKTTRRRAGADVELVFLQPGEAVCLANCRQRPWEPHKYATKAQQDDKLEFLLRWVSDYYRRDGDMSLWAHQELFNAYAGPKRLIGQQAVLPPG